MHINFKAITNHKFLHIKILCVPLRCNFHVITVIEAKKIRSHKNLLILNFAHENFVGAFLIQFFMQSLLSKRQKFVGKKSFAKLKFYTTNFSIYLYSLFIYVLCTEVSCAWTIALSFD